MTRLRFTPMGMKVTLIVAATCSLLMLVFAYLLVQREEQPSFATST